MKRWRYGFVTASARYDLRDPAGLGLRLFVRRIYPLDGGRPRLCWQVDLLLLFWDVQAAVHREVRW